MASNFFALYSAAQWPEAWALLSTADRAKIPEPTLAAQHKACPSEAAGMAYEIKSITMAGKIAVVTYTIPALEKLYGSATETMSYMAGSGWGIDLDAKALAEYSHGSVKADVAAAKAAGDCSGS
jgi:predicted MFS family arabinose efflux permease